MGRTQEGLERRRAQARARYARNPAKRKAEVEAAWAKLTPEQAKAKKRMYRKRQRDRFKAQGLTINGTARKAPTLSQRQEAQQRRNAEKAALRAWKDWMLRAPDTWMFLYYQSLGLPWKNPRLSESEKYSLQYKLDPEFRQGERERQRIRKLVSPEIAMQWERNGHRVWRAARSSDGSVTKDLVKEILSSTRCSYCLQLTPRRKRHVDHVFPLSRGGKHAADNLVMACAPCNQAKSNRMPLAFMLESLSGSLWEGQTRVTGAPTFADA